VIGPDARLRGFRDDQADPGTTVRTTTATPTLAAMSTSSSGRPSFDISAGAAIKLGFFVALGATLFSLILTVVAGVIGVVIALIFGTSLFALFGS
jgi:hypothetical protein